MSKNPALQVEKGIPSDPPSYDFLAASNEITPVPSRALSPEPRSPTPASSSSSLPNQTKNKNVPYTPSKELQKHIDRLGGGQPIISVTSGTRTEYFDVLPSFQMFQSILKRNDFEFDEDSLGKPPVYGDTIGSSPSPPIGLSPRNSSRETDNVIQSVAERLGEYNLGQEDDDYYEDVEGQYLFAENEDDEGIQTRARLPERLERSHNDGESHSRSASRQPGVPVSHETYGHSVLDNIDKLPRAKTSPLDVQIFVTKGVPIPNSKSELETKLKEYSCGDVVNGYIVITNNLDKKVDFGLFTVSLEGTVKTLYLKPAQPNVPEGRKYNKVMLKKFLKMYDMNASYNEGFIPNSAGIEYEPLEVDESDGSIMGLPNDRILEPRRTYKKFVTFKFPEMLLDNSCPHNVLRHTMPPPSFGVDITSFYDRASTIEVNKALGYGSLNVRGTPVKVRDYSFEDVSVSYSIEAKFIDKKHATNQHSPVHTNDINDPGNESKYLISKSALFFLRFVPDIKVQVETYSRNYKDFRKDTFESIGIDGMCYQCLTKCETWKFIKLMNLGIELEIQTALDKKECSTADLKRKNLHVREDVLTALGVDDDFKRATFVKHRDNKETDELLYYHERKMIGNQVPVDIFGKKKKRLLLSTVKIGTLTLHVKVPDKLIAYGSPRLLQKYNNGMNTPSSVNVLSPAVSRENSLAILPTMSHMGGLYNRNDSTVIKTVEIELAFDSLEQAIKPPSITLIEINVVAWSYKTDYPIPVSFEHDFFYTKPHDESIIVQDDDVQNTKDNLQDLKSMVNHYIAFLRNTKTLISQNTFSYLKGLSDLGVKKDTIKDYFQTLNSHSYPSLFNDDDWEVRQIKSNQIRWVKSLSLPLKVINKNSITLPPGFQNCLVGRLYCLQVKVKFKGGEELTNVVSVDVPALVG